VQEWAWSPCPRRGESPYFLEPLLICDVSTEPIDDSPINPSIILPQPSVSHNRVLPVNLFLQNADIGQISILLRIIQAVTDHKGIRNGEAAVIRGQIHRPAVRFVQQGDHLDRCSVALAQ